MRCVSRLIEAPPRGGDLLTTKGRCGSLVDMATITPIQTAPGEFVVGGFVAMFDEHDAAFYVYDHNEARVGVVRRLEDVVRLVANLETEEVQR